VGLRETHRQVQVKVESFSLHWSWGARWDLEGCPMAVINEVPSIVTYIHGGSRRLGRRGRGFLGEWVQIFSSARLKEV
jgi:hypothetical protein